MNLKQNLRKALLSHWGVLSISAGCTVASGALVATLKTLGIDCDREILAAIPVVTAGTVSGLLTNVAASYLYDQAKKVERDLATFDGVVGHDLQKLIRAALAQVCRIAAREYGERDAIKPIELEQLAQKLETFTDESKWEAITRDFRAGDGATEISIDSCVKYFEQEITQASAPSRLEFCRLARANWIS